MTHTAHTTAHDTANDKTRHARKGVGGDLVGGEGGEVDDVEVLGEGGELLAAHKAPELHRRMHLHLPRHPTSTLSTTHDTRHTTHDTRHTTHDTRHTTQHDTHDTTQQAPIGG
jgi:hypothetical protein